MLGRKQSIGNADWLAAIANIESVVTRAEIDALTEKTAADIRAKTRGKSAAFAWSGGKDSQVLAKVCQMAGIDDCVLVVSELEYPAFTQWVGDNAPPKLEIVNTGQDMEWLVKHPEMLFPQDGATAGQWFHIVQHRGQAKYVKQHNTDILILGRRKADGNYVGKGGNIYTSNGVTRYSPLSDWRHEDVLALIHYHKIALPPIYGWKNGYLCGTHEWAARQWTGSIDNGWREVFDIDRSIVIEAARYFDSAAGFLEDVMHGAITFEGVGA